MHWTWRAMCKYIFSIWALMNLLLGIVSVSMKLMTSVRCNDCSASPKITVLRLTRWSSYCIKALYGSRISLDPHSVTSRAIRRMNRVSEWWNLMPRRHLLAKWSSTRKLSMPSMLIRSICTPRTMTSCSNRVQAATQRTIMAHGSAGSSQSTAKMYRVMILEPQRLQTTTRPRKISLEPSSLLATRQSKLQDCTSS